MNIIYLSSYDLFIAFSLIILLGLISFKNKLEIHRPLFIASIRATIQLSLVGLVLNFVFTGNNFYFVAGIWLIMLSAAGYEVMSRQKFKEKGIRRYSTGTFSMFISSFSVLLLTLAVILNAEPWYSPRYAIPILGMLLGNTMNGIALGMNTFSNLIKNNRAIIEQRLSLGETADESIKDFLTE
ncbi:MAG: ABC transporter permease, partial [Candidatus Riflebacteria bacterium]|nr:ABC transporter permease [Candidatus Riflebacteria bacterium]